MSFIVYPLKRTGRSVLALLTGSSWLQLGAPDDLDVELVDIVHRSACSLLIQGSHCLLQLLLVGRQVAQCLCALLITVKEQRQLGFPPR